MQKKRIVTVLIILAIVAGYGWYVYTWHTTSSPNTWALPDPTTIRTEPETLPKPFDDLDPKLHLMHGTVLDPNVIQINYELKDVTLCGETYTAKQVMVYGVDLIQRVAQILSRDSIATRWFCELLYSGVKRVGGKISAGDEIHITMGVDGIGYSFAISLGTGLIDYKSVPPYGWLTGSGGVVGVEENKIIMGGGAIVAPLRE